MLTARELSEQQDQNMQTIVQDAIITICGLINPYLESRANSNCKSLHYGFAVPKKYHEYKEEIRDALIKRLTELGYKTQIKMDYWPIKNVGKLGTTSELSVLFNCDIKW